MTTYKKTKLSKEKEYPLEIRSTTNNVIIGHNMTILIPNKARPRSLRNLQDVERECILPKHNTPSWETQRESRRVKEKPCKDKFWRGSRRGVATWQQGWLCRQQRECSLGRGERWRVRRTGASAARWQRRQRRSRRWKGGEWRRGRGKCREGEGVWEWRVWVKGVLWVLVMEDEGGRDWECEDERVWKGELWWWVWWLKNERVKKKENGSVWKWVNKWPWFLVGQRICVCLWWMVGSVSGLV